MSAMPNQIIKINTLKTLWRTANNNILITFTDLFLQDSYTLQVNDAVIMYDLWYVKKIVYNKY